MAAPKKKAESWSNDPNRVKKNLEHLDTMEEQAKAAIPSKGVISVILPKLDIQIIQIHIIGDSPLICHKWSEKAKRQMLDKQMGVASAGRELKNPEQDYLDSLYAHSDGGYGFPAIAFKNAAVEACTSLGKSVTKVAARQAFHVIGELVKIDGMPSMREDMVKVGMDTADIRYRGEFKEWSAVVNVRYNTRVLTAEQIVNLFNTAGFAVGVGEWRPERKGSFGLFHVKTGRD